MNKNSDVRYICEVDERLGVFVRLYAIVESSMQKIRPELLIEQIRAQILPFDRTFGEHPINGIGNDAQLADLLGTILTSIERLCSQVCKEQEGTANVAIIIIRERVILCGILGDIVFALLRKNVDSYASEVGSEQYTLFSNCYTPQTLTGNNSATTNTLVQIYVHEVQPSDLRFFLFTRESIRTLLKSVPSLTLFTKSFDDIIWLLYSWQTEMFSKDPYKVPTVGFLLVDNLPKLIEESGTRLDPSFMVQLFELSEKSGKQQYQAKKIEREQRQRMLAKKLIEQSKMFGKSDNSTNELTVFLQTKLKNIRTKYNRITKLIDELLYQERDEMLAYIKREKEILNLEKECKQQTELKEQILNLQQRQQKQLVELRISLLKVLKYQDIVGCGLLRNIEKLEQNLDMAKFGADEFYLPQIYRQHERMRNIRLFQTKVEENLENTKIEMQKVIKKSFKMQRKIDRLVIQVERYKQSIGPFQGTRGQVYFRGARVYHADKNFPDRGFSKRHWYRHSNGGVFWNSNYNKNN